MASVERVRVPLPESSSADGEDLSVLVLGLVEAALVLESAGQVMTCTQNRGMLVSHRRALQRDHRAVLRFRGALLATQAQHVSNGMSGGQRIWVFFTESVPAQLKHGLVFGVGLVEAALRLQDRGDVLPGVHRLRVVSPSVRRWTSRIDRYSASAARSCSLTCSTKARFWRVDSVSGCSSPRICERRARTARYSVCAWSRNPSRRSTEANPCRESRVAGCSSPRSWVPSASTSLYSA